MSTAIGRAMLHRLAKKTPAPKKQNTLTYKFGKEPVVTKCPSAKYAYDLAAAIIEGEPAGRGHMIEVRTTLRGERLYRRYVGTGRRWILEMDISEGRAR